MVLAALFVLETDTARADESGCSRMHDWKSREPGFWNPWDKWHTTVASVIYDPEVVEYVRVADKGFRNNAHSSWGEGYLTNDAHPVCGGGEV